MLNDDKFVMSEEVGTEVEQRQSLWIWGSQVQLH